MCGFAGFLGGSGFLEPGSAEALLGRMNGAITHRGPDGDGAWVDPEARIALGHRRLAILDLSPAGAQPMASVTGRYVIIYNGELYNHLDLRAELEAEGNAPEWRGHSDTETFLAAVECWGFEKALKRSIGMFALALWDKRERHLILARDRVGEKPLYYGWHGEGANATFLFGSELKALARHPSFERDVDRGALSLFMRHNCVPAPYSIYRNIGKLMPGTFAMVSLDRREPVVETYWSLPEVAKAGVRNQLDCGPDEAIGELERLLNHAVGQQMISDVPLGAFLSGGVDSSTIVALMQAQSSRPVKTFSIGNQAEAYDEARFAKEVARHLGTDHTELYVSHDDALAVIPRLPALYDEPFADSSQIPVFLVSQLARQQVTVALSGDAGDELFCGYNRYTATSAYWRSIARVPRPLRKLGARAIRGLSPASWDRIGSALRPVLPKRAGALIAGDKLHKSAGILASRSVAEMYGGLVSHWTDPGAVVIDGEEPPSQLTGNAPDLTGLSDVERMMALDLLTYLPDDILVKVDRAAMAVSLETRVPFLDPRVIDFAWRLPFEFKLRDGQSKWALRQVLYRHVPRELIERPKQGFGIPIGAWLRGPLRDWAEALLDEKRLREEGYFRPDPIRAAWADHLSGRTTKEHHLWDVLMFQAWLEAEHV
jgi:asparagine synthase (glutamine-hydrolysing)